MNPKKSVPTTLDSCKCLCCTDCAYYVDESTSMFNCPHREILKRKQYNKMGKLGV